MTAGLAFVLGGGGARGAMQVGALRALLAAGYQPDLLVGTSIGAANAAGLALWGVSQAGIAALEQAYGDIATAHLMDPRLVRLALRILFGRPHDFATQQIREFFIALGITPELRFDQLPNIRLGLVGADLDTGSPVIYGLDPGESVLAGLMASIALPPWFEPVEQDGKYIVDGGALSNLPVEPALEMGAAEIIALDLNDPAFLSGNTHSFNPYVEKLFYAVVQRQIYLETALAQARCVPVRFIELRSTPPMPIWDFSNYQHLIRIGEETARRQIAAWDGLEQAGLVQPAPAPS